MRNQEYTLPLTLLRRHKLPSSAHKYAASIHSARHHSTETTPRIGDVTQSDKPASKKYVTVDVFRD